MKYYLIYFKSGVVVYICSFDDEQTRNTVYNSWGLYRNDELFYGDYDDLQCLNVAV